MSKITMEEAAKRLEQMNLNEDFLFKHTVADKRDGEEFARLFLEQVLGREVGKIRIVPQKYYPGVSLDKHGGSLDLYVEEYDKEVSNSEPDFEVFDAEPENSENRKTHLPKRVRFYRAKIDQDQLKSGDDYSQLPRVTIIFITTFDPFDLNRMVYTIRNQCVEVPEMPYEDGAETLFLNCSGTEGNPPKELKELLHYFRDTRAENAVNETLVKIHEIVSRVRHEEEVTVGYMKSFEHDAMILEEGIEKGVTKGELRNLTTQVCRKIKKGKDIDVIADELESDVDTIERIVEVASNYAPEYDVDAICKELMQKAEEAEKELLPA